MATGVGAVPRTRTLLYLYGAVTQIELKNFLDFNSIDTDQRKREIKAIWPTAAGRFAQLSREEAGVADTINSRSVRREDNFRVEALREDPGFISTFSNYPYSFLEVEIDKLVASQRTVHREYVLHLMAQFEHQNRDLVQFCLMPWQDATPVTVGRTAQNAFTLSSENPGLRFLGAYEQPFTRETVRGDLPGGQPVHLIALILGYGGSTVNVYRVANRMILNNGFHRLYALRSLGITHAPVVVQEIARPELELPPVIAELSRDYLVKDARPALLRDFLDAALTCEVTQRGFTKAVQVGWGISESMVPR
jgi:hypothetical protein